MGRHHEHHEHEEPLGGHIHGPWGRGGRGRERFAERGGWGGARRMRRGDIRRAILVALSDEPAHGYEVMRRLEEMSGGLWRPSPGSVYPHLQMLEDEGMVRSSEQDGSKTYQLTDAGSAEAAAVPTMPWESAEGEDVIRQLRHSMGQLMMAAKQLSGAGDESHIERGIDIIRKARQEIYRLLAED
jgi:DNA-binding PadR family transcriptional regulator